MERLAFEAESETRQRERRTQLRHQIDEDATLSLVHQGSSARCRVLDVSMGGCRLRTEERFLAGPMVRVELAVRIRGIALRFSGVTQWTDRRHLLGLRFVDLTARRREELAELLAEVAAENSAKAQERARFQEESPGKAGPCQEQPAAPAEKAAPRLAPVAPLHAPGTRLYPAHPPTSAHRAPLTAVPTQHRASLQTPPLPAHAAETTTAGANKQAEGRGGRERRAAVRHEVDTNATIFLVNVGSKLFGRILNISLGGCLIRNDERFPVGIYTRVETEFHLEGLPFRLGGVTQNILDKRTVGIRFLDMSERKREQLLQLIAEIGESRAASAPPEQAAPIPAQED